MRTLGLGTCLIAILAASALLDQESGVERWLDLRASLSDSAGRVGRLVEENDAMRREIEMLEAEPAALDRAIREELDVALPGEIVVRFTRPGYTGADGSSQADEGWALHSLLKADRLGSKDQETK